MNIFDNVLPFSNCVIIFIHRVDSIIPFSLLVSDFSL